MKFKTGGRIAIAAVLLSASLFANAQTVDEISSLEDEVGRLMETEAHQERLSDHQDNLASLQRLIAGGSLYLSMDKIVSHSVVDGAGSPDPVTLFGDTSDVRLELGARAKAMRFSASDYATVESSGETNIGTEDFSVFLWVRTSNSSITLLDKRQSDGGRGYLFAVEGGTVLLQMASAAGWNNYATSTSPRVNDGQWHHIGAVVDRDSTTGGKLYVDGRHVYTFDPTRHMTALGNTNKLFVSRHAFSGGSATGAIDEVFLTKRVISQSEINTLINSTSPSVARTTADAELSIDAKTATTITVSYRLPDPASSGFTDFRLCFSTLVNYEDNACNDPVHQLHHLSYNSDRSWVSVRYNDFRANTTYYLGLTGRKTDPNTGMPSVVRLAKATTTTLDSKYRDRVWHSDTTATSAKINWTTEKDKVTAYEVCWKKAGQAIGVCSNANYENIRSIASSTQEGSFTITGLIPSERYKYRVRAINDGTKQTVGDDTFTTNSAPRIDVWSQNITSNSMTIWWTANSIYWKYEVCWKKAGSAKDTCHDPKPVYSPTTNYQITGLRKDDKYRIKVYGITSGGNRAMLFDDTRKTTK